ncbi:Hypothetical predicted protein [Scomber scombrus]|uniref:Uncharacterized protein n=1 Tax=Scomber scombrus TaxID=13677 RepID=A0AAV1PKE6_SCOSC
MASAPAAGRSTDRGRVFTVPCSTKKHGVGGDCEANDFSAEMQGGQPEHSSRPHNGTAPQSPSDVCGDKAEVKLISKARGPTCLPHQARNRVESINKMKGIKEQLELSCVQ